MRTRPPDGLHVGRSLPLAVGVAFLLAALATVVVSGLRGGLPADSPLLISNALTLVGGFLLTTAAVISTHRSARAPDDAAFVTARE